jgi:hypothetical protein
MCTSHYNLNDWAEFGLGIAGAEQREKLMQSHLEGCMECQKTVRIWKRVRDMAGQEESFLPPESAVHYARTLYRVFPPVQSGSTLIQLARLIFDSRSQPALAGVRGGTAGPDRFVFQGGSLVLDVMVEPRLEGEPISLLGQIFDPQNPADLYDNLPVALVRDAGEMARTTTNRAGEFHLSFTPDQNLLLVVQLRHQAVLVSPLTVCGSQNYSS